MIRLATTLALATVIGLTAVPVADAQGEPPRGCPTTPFTPHIELRTLGTPDVGATVQLTAVGSQLRRRIGCEWDTEPISPFRWRLVSKPDGSRASLIGDATLTPSLRLDVQGYYRVAFLACSPDPCRVPIAPGREALVSEKSQTIVVAAGSTDLWVMGVELNQGFQDRVLTDFPRKLGSPGYVSIRKDAAFDPILTFKPLVVRAYVGVRPVSSDAGLGFRATGRLLARTQAGRVYSLTPLADGRNPTDPNVNIRCRRHNGRSDPCRSEIPVRPTFGSAGYLTNTPYDLDLVTRRVSWSRTLNFVLPLEVTDDLMASGHLRLRVEVTPVGFIEARHGDNTFTVDHRKIAKPKRTEIRLVRVRYTPPGGPIVAEPTWDQALYALRQIPRATPYASIDPGRTSDVISYSGERSVVVGVNANGKKAEWTLNECDSLWKKLWDRYGANSRRTLIAVLSSDVPPFPTCDRPGVGVRIPSGIPGVKPGGIAWAKIPTPSNGAAFPERFSAYKTLTHELYHAELDRRHVSKDHGEADGCSLGVLRFIGSLTGFDTSCWKPAPYAHGAIGEYPEGHARCNEAKLQTRVHPSLWKKLRAIGCRGTIVPWYHARGPLRGDLGAMGVDIQTQPNWDGGDLVGLVLVDPCPTPNAGSPLTAVLGRWDRAAGKYDCQADKNDGNAPDEHDNENDKAHDFMSYGTKIGAFPWTSRQQFFWPRFELVEPRD